MKVGKGKVMADKITLRDQLAIAWMTGMHLKVHINRLHSNPERVEKDRRLVAHEAYAFADAMLAERQVEKSKSLDIKADFVKIMRSDFERVMKYFQKESIAWEPVIDPEKEKKADKIARRNGLIR